MAAQVCFSDIDGTLVHYPGLDDLLKLQQEEGSELIVLPPSTTGRVGIISRESLRLAAALRASGARFAIVSGARTTTVLQRLPFLPAADAVVSENGGRIFYPDPDGLTAAPLREDLAWREVLAPVAGPVGQEVLPPERRQGELWDYYRSLKADGWSLDAAGYATAFRLTSTPGKSPEQLRAAIDRRPPSLKCTLNLGIADFYPAASGKEGAAGHLLAGWGASPGDAAFLCDDDNDLPLAAEVGKAFLPSIAEESVARAVEASPQRFVVSDQEWTKGTEQMLRAAAGFLAARAGAASAGAAAAGVGAAAAAAGAAAARGEQEEGRSAAGGPAFAFA